MGRYGARYEVGRGRRLKEVDYEACQHCSWGRDAEGRTHMCSATIMPVRTAWRHAGVVSTLALTGRVVPSIGSWRMLDSLAEVEFGMAS